MRVAAPDFDEARIVVLPHAVTRARQRTDLAGTDADVRAEIARLVVEAFRRRDVHDAKPRTFRIPGERSRRLRPGLRIAVFGDVAFVIDFGLAPQIAVVTTYVALRTEVPTLKSNEPGGSREEATPDSSTEGV